MNGDPWTEQHDQELRQWFANGRSNKEIAELAGRTENAIVKHKGLLGLRGGSATCQRCGALVVQKAGRPANYCSTACANWGYYEVIEGHKSLVEVKGVCAYCEKPFARMVRPRGQSPAGSAASAYCSRDCDKAAWYQRQKSGPGGHEFMRVRSERTNVRTKRLRAVTRNVQ
jgi:hypothetical protein